MCIGIKIRIIKILDPADAGEAKRERDDLSMVLLIAPNVTFQDYTYEKRCYVWRVHRHHTNNGSLHVFRAHAAYRYGMCLVPSDLSGWYNS